MPSIDDFDPTLYEPKAKVKPAAQVPPQPGLGERLLSTLAGAQNALVQGSSDAMVGGVKELGRQATNAGAAASRLGPMGGLLAALPQIQAAIGGAGRGDAPVPQETLQSGFAPTNTGETVGNAGARVGVPLLASLASAGAAGPVMAGLGPVARAAGGAGVDALASGAASSVQGEDPGQAAIMSLLGSGVGAAVGGVARGGSAVAEALAARKLARAGTPLQQANDALGVALRHVKEGQHPARAVLEAGIDLKAEPTMVERQITNAIEKSQAIKGIISSTMAPVKADVVAKALDNYADPILTVLQGVEKKVASGKLPADTMERFDNLLDLVTAPRDAAPIAIDTARAELRTLLDEFAAGNKKKGVRKGLEAARKALSDLTPELKSANRDMSDLIAARNALRDRMLKEGAAGVPTPEPNAVAELLSRIPIFGAKGAAIRAAGRMLK